MNDDYAPPTEPGAPVPVPEPVDESVYWWAQLSRLDATGNRATTTSPNFPSEEAALAWLRLTRQDGDVEYAAKRTARASGTSDEPIALGDGGTADHQRLGGLLDSARAAMERPLPVSGERAESTGVTEDEDQRRQMVTLIEQTRSQRAFETRTTGFDATLPMLTYEQVYDEHGNVRPEFEAEVRAMQTSTALRATRRRA